MAGKSFLIIRLSSLGDIVHALPAVAALAQMPSGGAVDWLIETRYRVLLNGNPYLRNVVEIDTLGTRGKRWSFASLKSMLNSVGVLRRERYDAVVDLQSLVKTALLARCARAQQRIGFEGDWAKEPMAGVLYTHAIRVPSPGPRDSGQRLTGRISRCTNRSLGISSAGEPGGPRRHGEKTAGPGNPGIHDRESGRRLGGKALGAGKLCGARWGGWRRILPCRSY